MCRELSYSTHPLAGELEFYFKGRLPVFRALALLNVDVNAAAPLYWGGEMYNENIPNVQCAGLHWCSVLSSKIGRATDDQPSRELDCRKSHERGVVRVRAVAGLRQEAYSAVEVTLSERERTLGLIAVEAHLDEL